MHPMDGSYYGAPPVPYRQPLASAIPGIRPGYLGGPRPPMGGTPYGAPGVYPPPAGPGMMASVPHMYPFKPPTFDAYLCESFFQRVNTEAEDTALTQVYFYPPN
jgi:hypothetical protein